MRDALFPIFSMKRKTTKVKKTVRRPAKAKKKKVTKTKTRTVKKVRKVKKKVSKAVKAKKKVNKAVKTKRKFSIVVKPSKRVSQEEIARAMQEVQKRLIGKVVHYYDKIGVAIVDLQKPLRIGDTIVLRKGNTDQIQRVTSLQIEHVPVIDARKGDVVGMKVEREAPEGTVVLPV